MQYSYVLLMLFFSGIRCQFMLLVLRVSHELMNEGWDAKVRKNVEQGRHHNDFVNDFSLCRSPGGVSEVLVSRLSTS